MTTSKLVLPKLVRRILHDFIEGSQKPPRMRSLHEQAFHQHSRDLLTHRRILHLKEEVAEDQVEVERVRIQVAKLVGHRIQQMIAT